MQSHTVIFTIIMNLRMQCRTHSSAHTERFPQMFPLKKLRKWLAVICSNEARTLLARKKHIVLADDVSCPLDSISPYGNPHDLKFFYEDITYAAVKLAPAKYQQALHYFYKSGDSLLQAARMFGIPESNLRYWRNQVARKAKEFL